MKVAAIVQARMKSSRLPDKVMLDLAGKPMLARVIERVSLAHRVDQVIVATASGVEEDPIADLCAGLGVACFRGSLQDVLDRYFQAASQYQADVVVRITADCPVVDPGLIDETVAALLGQPTAGAIWKPQSETVPQPGSPDAIPWEYASTRLPPPWHRTFPIGLDVEAVPFTALERAWREATAPYEREHVLPFLYDQPGRFRCLVADWTEDLGSYRWTVDTAADLEVLRRVYTLLAEKPAFTWLDVLAVYRRHPELAQGNAGIRHKDFREVDPRN